MIDSRLTWLAHFSSCPEKLAVVIPKSSGIATLETLTALWRTNIDPKIVEAETGSIRFRPLEPEAITHLGCETIAYLIRSWEPSSALQQVLLRADQVVQAEYSVFPTWQNPRWFIPGWRSVAPWKMSRMVQPTKLIARLAVFAFRLLRLFGLAQVIAPCRLVIAQLKGSEDCDHDSLSFLNFFQGELDGLRTGVLYTGSFGPLQKFTVELMNKGSLPFAYAKFGHNEYGRLAIVNEQNSLKKIAALSLSNVVTPQLLEVSLSSNLVGNSLVVGRLDGGVPLTKVTDAVMRGLVEIYTATCQPNALCVREYLSGQIKALQKKDCRTFGADFEKIRIDVVIVLEKILPQINDSLKLPLAFSHGDFTRWNVRADAKKIYVIDWEEAAMRAPGHDLLSFLLAEYLLVQQMRPETAGGRLCQEVTNGRLQDYLDLINEGEKIEAKLLGVFFCLEILLSAFWHAEKHEMHDYPVKTDFIYIAQTSCFSLRKLTEVVNKDGTR